MSGIDPDEEANVTENPDPESESAASVNAENDLPESNPNDGVEEEINVPVNNEHLPQENGSHPENAVDENVEENKAEEDGQGQDECVMNVEGDEKAEDEREADGGVIREGQISCGRDEQLIQGIGQEEAEADASLVRDISASESHTKYGASPHMPNENESEPINVLEQSEQRVNDAREEENISEGSNSVINLGSDGSNSESNLVQCGVNNVVENLSPENSEVVDGNAVIPEDEICCQNWTSEARPQLHVLSPTESIESYEPECDQEADISPSHEPEPVNSDEPEQANSSDISPSHEPEPANSHEAEPANSSDMNETCERGGGDNPQEETICVVVDPSSQNPALSDKEFRTDHVTSSQNDTKTTSCSTESNECEGAGLSFVNVNGSVTNHIESGNKISSYESDDDLLSELESELTNGPRTNQTSRNGPDAEVNPKLPNGMCGTIDHKVRQEIQDLQMQLKHSRDKLEEKEAAIKRLTIRGEEQETYVERILKERDSYLKEIRHLKSQDDLYLPQIKELEYTIAQQTNEIRTVKDKLTSHDAAAKRTVAALQNELKVRVDQVTKMYEEANKEKDTMVVKYAMAEKKFIEGQKAIERLESKVRDLTKEKEGVTQRVKDIKGEKHRLMADLEAKAAEVQGLTKEVEKQSELISSSEVRIKWAQNKLRAELDAHKETKEELSKTRSKLKDAKDETEQIRRDCQAIIKTYQESEEIKSNKLDSELKMKESEFLQQQQEKTSQEEKYAANVKELASLKEKHQITMKEMESLKKKCQNLESQRDLNEQTMTKYKDMLQKQKKENKELQDRVEELIQVKSDFKRAQSTIKSLDAEISELKISNKDLQIDMEACRKREAEKLDLTKKLSEKNAGLQSENSVLHNKTVSQTEKIEKLTVDLQTLEIDFRDISERLKKEEVMRREETAKLKEKLDEKSKAVEELSAKVEDTKDEIKTIKRKHVNNVKDLTRQLQQAKKKLEHYETNGEGQKDSTSMGSRTSSSNSLNTMGVSENNSAQSNSYTNKYPGNSEPVQEYPVITEQVEPDSRVLIERIVKLQRGLARRNEKIEFMHEHIQQLVDEIQKKNKIIQNYALREESGTMTLERADLSKVELSKKHSIMGSLYSSHQTDSAMTLDLSLEINHKLQAVLEDALLKNITLKESLDTLGGEIARLSQENRQLQLQIQEKAKKR